MGGIGDVTLLPRAGIGPGRIKIEIECWSRCRSWGVSVGLGRTKSVIITKAIPVKLKVRREIRRAVIAADTVLPGSRGASVAHADTVFVYGWCIGYRRIVVYQVESGAKCTLAEREIASNSIRQKHPDHTA